MGMSRRHYRAVAEVLNDRLKAADWDHEGDPIRRDAAHAAVLSVARELCPVFRADNSAFDSGRFMGAVTEGT